MSGEIQVFRCSNCGALVDVSPFSVVVVCGYCGWVSVVDGQSAALFAVAPEDRGVLRNLLESYVRKKAGAVSVIRDIKYLMVPMWLVEVDASTKYNGYRVETRSKTIETDRGVRERSYRVYVPVRGSFDEKVAVAVYGRKFEGLFGLGTVKYTVLRNRDAVVKLDPSFTKGWEVLGSELSTIEAVEAARTRVAEEHRRRAEKMSSKLFDCYTTTSPLSARLILYPVVEARYESRGKSYRVCVDGAKARAKILKAELPITLAARVARAVAGVGVIVALALVAVFLQPLVGSGLPEEAQLLIVAGPPLAAAAAGLAGSYSATVIQKTTKAVDEADLWVMR